MRRRVLQLLCSAAVFCRGVSGQSYAGAAACSSCHRAIYDSQALTAMAQTWRGTNFAFSDRTFAEGEQLRYEARRQDERVTFSMSAGGADPLSMNVQAMVGGKRHGISLLFKIDEMAGVALERPAMMEARYALFHTGELVLSPGFPKQQPQDLEHQLGRVLTPDFEVRCLTCHGKPGTLGAGSEGGVRCESCHGPSAAHVAAAQGRGARTAAIVRPKSLRGADSMEICAQCHSGFKPRAHADPAPGDLLVSSQTPALQHSECFIQSGGQLVCTSCHNPHKDSTTLAPVSVNVCLRCHSITTPKHAAICPVNQTQGCVGCHMPTAQVDSFRVADHWIRVQPGASRTGLAQNEAFRSQVVPRREFLRLIAVATDEEMSAVTERLAKGDSFSAVARELSSDASAGAGGFLGDVALADMDPVLAAAAAHLAYDSKSAVARMGDQRVMLYRLPRDFKWTADRLYHEALQLNEHGDRALAIQKIKQALDTYPYQLSGLNLMGILLREAGDARRAAATLGFAAQTYPQDAATQYNLALTQDSAKQIESLRRVIELDPDIIAAYQSLGTALYADGQRAAAVRVIREGLQIDPLSAILHYDLGLLLQEEGDAAGAASAFALAARVDPKMAVKIGQ